MKRLAFTVESNGHDFNPNVSPVRSRSRYGIWFAWESNNPLDMAHVLLIQRSDIGNADDSAIRAAFHKAVVENLGR